MTRFQGVRPAVAPPLPNLSWPRIAAADRRGVESIPMKRIVALIAGSLCATGLYAQDPKPIALKETVDTLAAKNAEAKGGAQALAAVQSLRLSGKMLVNNGKMELGYTAIKKKPGEFRAEITLQGMTQVLAYDGT